MKNVAFVVGPALGHISRMFTIASELADTCDCRITFISPAIENHLEALVGERFETAQIPFERNADFGRDLQDLTGQRRFDLMAFDLNPLRWLQEYRRPALPCAYVTNVFLTGAAGLETAQAQRLAKRRRSDRKTDGNRGLALGSAYDLYEFDRVLLADPAPFAERYAPLPEHYRICGACFWSLDGDLPASLEAAHDVLLISMGSTGRRPIPPGLVNALVEAAGCAMVVVAGTKVGDMEGIRVPVQAFSRLAIRQLLPRVRLVLSSGGTGSTYLALEAGVPTVVWPSHRNHAIMGEILEEMELGLLAREERDTGADLARAFPTLAASARRFAPAASSRLGIAAAAAELRTMLS